MIWHYRYNLSYCDQGQPNTIKRTILIIDNFNKMISKIYSPSIILSISYGWDLFFSCSATFLVQSALNLSTWSSYDIFGDGYWIICVNKKEHNERKSLRWLVDGSEMLVAELCWRRKTGDNLLVLMTELGSLFDIFLMLVPEAKKPKLSSTHFVLNIGLKHCCDGRWYSAKMVQKNKS